MKILKEIEIEKSPNKSQHDYVAEFIWDASEGQTTWYKCNLFTYVHSEWCEVAEGGYVVDSGYNDEIVISRIDNITFYRLIGDDEIEQTGSFNPTPEMLALWVSELTDAVNTYYERFINNN
jgi:hypothetical protein